ncbi:MAG: hypothetical protein ACMV1K_13135 [Sulfurospirillum sp.]
MTFSIYLNQPKMLEWDLSFKAGILLSKMAELSSWATPITIENEVYYMLFRKKIQSELPLLGKNFSSISKTISELESKSLIESIQKNSTPAYRLSAKGKQWLTASINANDGESSNDNNSEISPEKKAKFTFDLKMKRGYSLLSQEYKENLEYVCQEYAKNSNIPADEFGAFVDWHSAKGTLHQDWSKAFKYWCTMYKKRNRTNGGELSKDDYFSNNGKGLYS